METPAERPRPRVLMVAYACRPGEGSEPGLGWHRAGEAARRFDVWVLCEQGRNAPAIERYQREHGATAGMQFVYVPRSRWQTLLGKIPGGFYLAYNLWHRAALKTAQALHAEIGFDLVHQVTYCGFREPGYAWRLPTRFVWGPIGGTHNFPLRFLSQAGVVGAASELWRSLANFVQFRFSGRVRKALHASALTLVGNSTTQRHFRERFGVELPILPANGIDEPTAAPRKRRAAADTVRLLWCGRLHPLKGLPLVLHALAKLPPDAKYTLRVLGDGPARRRYQRMAERLGIGQRIEWCGWVPHKEVSAHYHWADLLVFTSLRDTMPGVLLEALAHGLPVICLDHLGMGDAVTADCGVKLPLTSASEVIDRLGPAIVATMADGQEWERLSQGAIERARLYTWRYQGEQLARHYWRVLGLPDEEPIALAETSVPVAPAMTVPAT